MILSLIFGFIAGIWIGSFVKLTLGLALIILALAGLFYFYKYFVPKENHRVLFLAMVFVLGALCGFVRVSFSNLYAHSQLDSFAGKKISAQGIIVDEPDERESNVKLTVRLSQIGNTPMSEKILVTAPLYPQLHYGDKIQLDTVLELPKNIDSPDGRIFDYAGYLKARGIWYTTKFAAPKLVSSGHGAIIQNVLFKLKEAFTAAIGRVLPEPESSLMGGLLLGAKQSLGKKLLAEFQLSGVSHVVVLSGYNIVIVAESIIAFLAFVFPFLSKNISFGLGGLCVLLFTLASGGGASAWRATIMVLVALFAKRTNREYSAGKAFGLAVVLMLILNPLLLVFDPSFQLSVLATIGLIFVSPYVEPYVRRIPKKYGLREIISSTIATQIIVLPYLIYTTGIVSLVSLPVNILILGTIPLTMFFGFLCGSIGLFSFWLSFIPAFFAYILLWYQLTIVHIGATLPFGALTLPAFSPIILIFVYAIIFAGLYFLKKKTIKN